MPHRFVTQAALFCFAGLALYCQSDLISFREVSFAGQSGAEHLVITGQGRYLFSVAGDTLFRWDTQGGSADSGRPLGNRKITALACARDGSVCAAGRESGEIALHSWGGAGRVVKAHSGAVRALAFSSDGLRVASGSRDGEVAVASTATASVSNRFSTGQRKAIVAVAFRSQDTQLSAVGESGLIVDWDAAKGTQLRRMEDPDRYTVAAAFSQDGALLALISEFGAMNKGNPMGGSHPSDFYRESRIKLYDMDRAQMRKQLDSAPGALSAPSFTSDQRFLAVMRKRVNSATIAVFDVVRGVEVTSLPTNIRSGAATFSDDGRWFAAGGSDGRVRLHQVEGVLRGTTVEDLAGQKIRITSAATKALVENPAGLRVAVLDLDGIRVEQDMARIVSEMIRNRFAGLQGLVLVDRTRMAQVIAEQNIQFSDRTDSTTAVKLGRILNVQKIVMGSLSQLGSNFSISVQLVDVETARIDGIREVLCQRCSIDDMPAAVAALQGALIGN